MMRLFLSLSLVAALAAHAGGKENAYAPKFTAPAVFKEAVAKQPEIARGHEEVTGITVPHHLLVPDLMALGYAAAARGRYDRVVFLFPDHYKKLRGAFATSLRGFETVLGPVHTDEAAAKALLDTCPLMESSDLFATDHGIQALLPFQAHYLPDVPVLPVAISIRARTADLDKLIEALIPLITPRTLIVQSTDFSHYLTPAQARSRDQETLNLLVDGNPELLVGLNQPEHLDSRGAQYVHSVLQKRVFGAALTVLANRNSQHYTLWPINSSTSYIVQVYERPQQGQAAARKSWPMLEGDEVFFFAGDVFFGRGVKPWLADPATTERVKNKILEITGGAPMAANLEGVVFDKVPQYNDPMLLGMESKLALGWLKSLNVRLVSLANNHSLDFGEKALNGTRALLKAEGIASVLHGESHDLGSFRLAAYSDVPPWRHPGRRFDLETDCARLREKKLKPPVVTFMHWGAEYTGTAGPRENQMTRGLVDSGTRLIVGAHSHQASRQLEALFKGKALRCYSLGNFIFDQNAENTSGALLEVRIFKQGTMTTKLHPLGNLFRDLRKPGKAAVKGL